MRSGVLALVLVPQDAESVRARDLTLPHNPLSNGCPVTAARSITTGGWRESRAPRALHPRRARSPSDSVCTAGPKQEPSTPWGVLVLFVRSEHQSSRPARCRSPRQSRRRGPPFRAKEGPGGAGGGARRRTRAGPPGVAGSSWEEKEKSRTTLPGWLRVLPVREAVAQRIEVLSPSCSVSGPPGVAGVVVRR
jgi:hypothetical protein